MATATSILPRTSAGGRASNHLEERAIMSTAAVFHPSQKTRRVGHRVRCRCSHTVAVCSAATFLPLPVHYGRAFVIDLHADTCPRCASLSWIARDHAGRVMKRPHLSAGIQDREIEQREVVALDYLFARAGRDGLGEELAHLGQHGSIFTLSRKPCGDFTSIESADAVATSSSASTSSARRMRRPEPNWLMRSCGAGVAFHVLKQQRPCRRPFPAGLIVTLLFETRSGNFRLISRLGSARLRIVSVAGSVERFDPVAKSS